MPINILDGTGGYDGKVSPRYLQRVVNRIVKYITDETSPSESFYHYVANVEQTSVDPPIATVVFKNTFPDGFISGFTFVGEGEYTLSSLDDLFTPLNTTVEFSLHSPIPVRSVFVNIESGDIVLRSYDTSLPTNSVLVGTLDIKYYY